jgi:flap endonuclease-1
MGIRGLTGWIQWAAAKALKQPNWSAFKGKRVGIDILGFLYKAKAKGIHPVAYIAHLIAQCRIHSIQPIPIFDGKPPDEKRDIIRLRNEARLQNDQKRKDLADTLETTDMSADQKDHCAKEIQTLAASSVFITTDERDEVKKFLYACGVKFLNANGEADNVLAYLAKRGDLSAVMTNDMDLLTRGVPVILVPSDLGVPGDTKGWISYSLADILKESGIFYRQFVEMCVLMGCDYTTKVQSIPYKMAYFQIKYNGLQKTLKDMDMKDPVPYEKAVSILNGDHDTAESLMSEKQWAKWANPETTFEIPYLTTLRETLLETLDADEYAELTHSETFAHKVAPKGTPKGTPKGAKLTATPAPDVRMTI